MPADRNFLMVPGRRGLNLRDHPSELALDELSDSLNWQIEQRGSLTRRLGTTAYGSGATDQPILNLGKLEIAGGNTYLVAHCVDGSLQTSPDGDVWTAIAPPATFSTSQPAAILQFNDKVYISDGTNDVQEWDGATLNPVIARPDIQIISISGAPTGGPFTISYGGVTSAAIAYNAAASAVQTALEGMTTIGAGNVVATGGPLPGSPVTVTFTGALANQPVALMSHTDSLTGGTSPAVTVTHSQTGQSQFPHAKYLATWRGHVFAAGISGEPRTVRWSKIFDPHDWSITDNNVVFLDAEEITAIHPAPPSNPTADGVDGLLVFKRHSTYRIIDPSDNALGVSTGGSYELVDRGAGCYAWRTITPVSGQLYLLGEAGVYRTDGHAPLQLASAKLAPLMRDLLGLAGIEDTACSASFKGRYYLAIPTLGSSRNTRLLELYLDFPADNERQHPWMAHTIPSSSLLHLSTSSDEFLLGVDARTLAANKIRRLFFESSDIDDTDTPTAISADAATGGLSFDDVAAKRMKRIEVRGRGNVMIKVSSDFESASGESGIFQMPVSTGALWGAFNWGAADWGGADAGSQIARARYTRKAKFFTLHISASGEENGSSSSYLGLSSFQQGGAAVHSMELTVTPLDTY